jgi:hypothetical protein
MNDHEILPCLQEFCPFGEDKWEFLAACEGEGITAKAKEIVKVWLEVRKMETFLDYAKRYKIKVLKRYDHLKLVLVETDSRRLAVFIAKLMKKHIIGSWKNVPVKSI